MRRWTIRPPTTTSGPTTSGSRAAGGFGVPTLFLLDGQCLFGPVLVDPPTGPAALTLWSVVTGMAELPHVYELQRPKSTADAELIGRRLRPYLDGRDWVSINRGEIVDVDQLIR